MSRTPVHKPVCVHVPDDIYALSATQAAQVLAWAEAGADAASPPCCVAPESDPAALREGLELLRVREMLQAHQAVQVSQQAEAVTDLPQPAADRPKRPPKLLVTGFDPFNNQDANPAGLVAQSLPPRIRGVEVVGREIPTQYRVAVQRIAQAAREVEATHVICLGMDGSRPGLCPERRGYNWADVSIADNAGVQLSKQLLLPHGPLACHTTLLPEALAEAAQHWGVTAEVSDNPGSFVCNNVTYELGHELATAPDLRGTRYTFVHVPKLPHQSAPHTMSLDTIRRGVLAMLSQVVDEALGSTQKPQVTWQTTGSRAEAGWWEVGVLEGVTLPHARRMPLGEVPHLFAEVEGIEPAAWFAEPMNGGVRLLLHGACRPAEAHVHVYGTDAAEVPFYHSVPPTVRD